MFKLFDFYCEQCGKTFEKLVKKGVRKVSCPDCGSECGTVPGNKGQVKFKKGKTLVDSEQLQSSTTAPGLRRV